MTRQAKTTIVWTAAALVLGGLVVVGLMLRTTNPQDSSRRNSTSTSSSSSSSNAGLERPRDEDSGSDRTPIDEAALVEEAGRLSIRGRVLLVTGEPVPSATVVSAGGRSIHADDQGRFELAALAPGEYWLRAEAPGLAAHPAAPVRLSVGDIDGVELLLEEGRTLHGVVRDTHGTPIEGATIEGHVTEREHTRTLGFAATSPVARRLRTESDERGVFELAPLPAGTVEVTVSHRGFVGFGRAYPTDGGPLEIVLAALPSVSGLVVDHETDETLAVARVSVLVSRRDMDGPWVEMDDPSAHALLDASPGPFRLWPRTHRPLRLLAHATGYAPVVSDPFQLRGSDVGPLTLRAERGIVLRGRVVAPLGAAVEGAELVWTPIAADSDDGDRVLRLAASAETDSSGRFECRLNAPGTSSLVARAAGFLEHRSEVEIEQDGEDALTIELVPAAALTVTVDAAGDGRLPAFWVRVDRSDELPVALIRRVESRVADFSELAPGAYSIALHGVEPRGRSLAPLAATTVELGPGEAANVVLRPVDTSSVQGQLVVDGDAAPFARIALLSGPGELRSSCVTDRLGHFAFQSLAAGRYSLDVGLDPRTPTSLRHEIELEVGEELEVSLSLSRARLRGRVARAEDERPLRGVEIVLESLAEPSETSFEVARVRPDAEGFFERANLASGRVLVSVQGPFRVTERREVELAPGDDLDLGILSLRPAGRLTLSLRVASDRPRPAGMIVVELTPHEAGVDPILVTREGPGSIEVDGLPPGRVEIEVRRSDAETLAARSAWVTAQHNESVVIDIQ